ncbi:MAG TPA: porin [Roseiarcus sp.]
MTLMKSLLLGSAATLVVVAGAQAADLPTRKGAPAAEYVKVCHIDGIAGFVIPGSDTCLKITGYLTAQIEGGNLDQGYAYTSGSQLFYVPSNPNPRGVQVGNPIGNGTSGRNEIGYTTRAELEFITKTNTAYGVLTSDIDTQFNYGSGFDNTGAGNGFINHGFLNWAGITAGKANSFFSFFGGGEGWANVFSPDQQGYNQPLLLAYTATFGGGFSATISIQDPILTGPSSGATLAGTDEFFFGNSEVLGLRSPDIVGSIDLKQGWGGAHIAGVAHNVRQQSLLDNSTIDIWGWAIDGGLKFDLSSFGAGDNIQLQGVYSENAIWYSGVSDAMWGENGATNGNGIAMPVTDAFSNGNGTWATPDAWSLTALGEFHLGPTWSIDPEISYLQINWSGVNTGLISPNQESWIGGGVIHWDPVPHLDFNLELLYQTTHQSMPAAYSAVANGGLPWHANTDGLEGRFEITRDF